MLPSPARFRCRYLTGLAALIAAACGTQRAIDNPRPASGATCYRAVYRPDSLAPRFPTYFAIGPGRDSGQTHWLRAPGDTVRLYPIIYKGRWVRPDGDSLQLRFGYFVDVLLKLQQRADTLFGSATWTPDWTGEPSAHGSVRARPSPCTGLQD